MLATLLAVDLGTQSLRLTAIDVRGERLWSWCHPIESRIDGDIYEQDATVWADLLAQGLAEAARAGVKPTAIAAAGPLAGYVPINADGAPLGKAVMYFDRRSAPDLATVEAALVPRTNPLRPTIADPIPQLLRLRREAPNVYARAQKLLDATGFLVYQLTGVATLDEYTALRLYDPATLRAIGIHANRFGRLVAVGDIVGPLCGTSAAPFGGGSIPVVAATFDSKSAYLGSGIASEGDALDISGTVTSFGVVSARPIVDPDRRIYSVPFGESWLARGSMGGAGSILEWARREVIGGDFESVEAAVAASPPGAGGATFLPYHSGARAPLWNPHAKGAFVGLTLDTSQADIARAIYEGLAFGLRHIVDTMAECGARVTNIRLAGGLARSDALARIKTDVLGRPTTRLTDHELTTFGLAAIAGVAIGAFPDRATANGVLTREADRFTPAATRDAYEEPYRRYLAAVDALRPTFTPRGCAALPEPLRRPA